ncbi:hypothetical protein [Halalkalicoccus sp. NIPERK01]|uniref:HoxN/HupN/NixA family nickel/cobalt transporter n=1 Tax=Halalkalicoccus sp. NIPERK01 TaxID=3053469 RepID=UPI00256EA9FE|nr:hypothetical protein [Halalkalicoccus sp. NIPERK01]MDL5360456.1 hypothetical protein [Halalkalicoccus sp. NIPERK01]
MASGAFGLAVGATALGLMHGLAPGHGWAIAASYALDKPNKWFYGLAASLVLGVGHLVSSIAMVVVYFWALSYFGLTRIGWMNYVAGALLIGLGVWQYVNGHHHSVPDRSTRADDHGHDHADHDHEHVHEHVGENGDGPIDRLRRVLPFVGDRSHHDVDEADRGLYGMAVLAFVLGFTHNEEFDIIAICTGSAYCLELMVLYSLAVIVSLVGVTLLLVASYERYEERLEGYAHHLPTFTAAILVLMGIGFLLGVF